eukprot:1191489-Prorocentrum_minimum.AAC.3
MGAEIGVNYVLVTTALDTTTAFPQPSLINTLRSTSHSAHTALLTWFIGRLTHYLRVLLGRGVVLDPYWGDIYRRASPGSCNRVNEWPSLARPDKDCESGFYDIVMTFLNIFGRHGLIAFQMAAEPRRQRVDASTDTHHGGSCETECRPPES